MNKASTLIVTLTLLLSTVNASADYKGPEIEVDGAGEVSVSPDIAFINVSIEARNMELKAARKTVSLGASAAVKVLEELKIRPADMDSTGIVVRPEFKYRDGGEEFVGYFVSRNIRVRLIDIDQIGLVTEKLLDAGINKVSNPELSSSKATELKRRAIELASADAKANAAAVARGLNLTLGKVLKIETKSSRQAFDFYDGSLNFVAAESPVNESARSYRTGDIKYSASVRAQFAIAE